MIPAGVLRVLLVTPGVLVVVGVFIAVGQDSDDGTDDIVYIEDMVSGLDMSTGRVHNESGPKPDLRLQSKEPWIECPGGNETDEQYMKEVKEKYRHLLNRQPRARARLGGVFIASGIGVLTDSLGIETGQVGIYVNVYRTPVPQSELPPEDRLPECLEGVPVQVRASGPRLPLYR